jgi:ribosomal protein S7
MKQLQKYKLSLKTKISNHLMINGQKKTCEKIFLKSLKMLQKTVIKNHHNILKLAIINSAPIIRIKQIKKKKKKVIKEFPFFLNEKNRISFSIKNILSALTEKSKINIYSKLKQEIFLSSQNKNEILKKQETLQNYALTKKKYSHYRWFY